MSTENDRIVKRVLLRAPRERVWQAISDSQEFGTWIGADFEGPVMAGKTVRGHIAPTRVDPEIARKQQPHAGTPIAVDVESVEPGRLLAFRWHPFSGPGTDVEAEPTTLVELALEDAPDGTLLTVTESGFDRIPAARRAAAFESNEKGWTAQMSLIEKYLAGAGAREMAHGARP